MRASFFRSRVVGKEKKGRGKGRAESTDEWDARVAEVDALRDSSLGCLPRSIFADVVSRLDGPDVARLGMTCRAARTYCSRPAIWRALARAQEPPALVREDLVNRDFTWKQLYAWRRHVLWHRARGVDRIAVADHARVLTCDPLEGGGRVRVAHEASSPQPLAPNLLAWSPDASMLVVAQESAEGCRLVLSAPTACLRPKRSNRFGGDRRRIDRRRRAGLDPNPNPRGTGHDEGDGYGSEDATMGDEDSTAAAGHGLGTARLAGTNGGAVLGGGDSGDGGVDAPRADDEDDSVDANKAKEPRGTYPRGIVAPDGRVRSHKLPAMNSVHVPLQNPVFAAFAACGTRLLLMNVRRHGEEFALHELDLTVAMASLHGATPGAAGARGLKFLAKNRRALAAGTKRRRGDSAAGDDDDDDDDDAAANVRGVGPDGWLSADARETLTLVESGRELSFSPGPSTRDVLSLANGAVVGKISPANLRAWSGLDECTTHPVAGGRLGCARLARALEQDEDLRNENLRKEDETSSEGSFELDGDELEDERDRAAARKTHPAWRAGAGGVGGASTGAVADPLAAAAAAAASDDDEGGLHEVSSAPESLWWRRSVDAFRGGYSAGVETLRSAAARLARSLLPAAIVDPGRRGGRRRGGSVRGGRGEREEAARRRAAEVERRSRSGGRAIKRARLTGRAAAAAGAAAGGGDRWAVGGFSRLGKAKKGSGPSASGGFVNPFACAIPSVRRARPSDVVTFRRDRMHETSLPGLAHIVQWVRPARRIRRVRGSNPVAGGGEDDSNHHERPGGDGHWLVPVSFPDAMPRAVHLALLPAIPTPGPDEVRGTDAQRRESARLALLGLADPSTRSAASRVAAAVDRSGVAARSLFSKDHGRLEDACVVELAPPAAYNELHVVVSTVAAAAPGGKIVCWADDGALWATRAVDDPDGNRTWDRATRVLDLRRCGFGADAGLRIDDEGSVAPNPVLHQVCAMQWSASGTRLLALVACHFTTSSHVFPMHQWMVWDPPATWLGASDLSRLEDPSAASHGDGCFAANTGVARAPLVCRCVSRSFEASLAGGFRCSHGRDRYRCEECGGGGVGEDVLPPETLESIRARVDETGGFDPDEVLGVITRGRWHVPTKTFVQDVLPIFEQYSQTHSLWNPDEDRVCYPVRSDGSDQGAGIGGGDHVWMARFPRMPIVHRLASVGAGRSVRQVGEHNALPFKHAFADSAVVVCEGSFCVWSPC